MCGAAYASVVAAGGDGSERVGPSWIETFYSFPPDVQEQVRWGLITPDEALYFMPNYEGEEEEIYRAPLTFSPYPGDQGGGVDGWS